MSSAEPKVYRVKEAYYTLQGEGMHAGRAALLCRFEGCDRHCAFCDTDFMGVDGPGGGTFYSAAQLAEHLLELFDAATQVRSPGARYVIFTGGEPSLQLDEALLQACKERGFTLGIETHGGHVLPAGLDWICVSPKGWPIAQQKGHELKVVWPGGVTVRAPGESVEDHEARALALLPRYEALDFEHLFLQPEDGPDREWTTASAVRAILRNPRWRLSLQQHKYLGLR